MNAVFSMSAVLFLSWDSSLSGQNIRELSFSVTDMQQHEQGAQDSAVFRVSVDFSESFFLSVGVWSDGEEVA